ncbi:unnamed protein product [Fusarium graminearum]|uniref:Chromosome 1, complete genome n=1 Tax=Gibberella zeae (strain ATCC MYA-4620 / CBS 123657 / FGSC 9075 / NRRL 31084 / PH-1) TaxID=229533 RepID=A0A0E0RVR2_GIBZE|nr:hypothetical protein FG05_30559 [Fusarium graminearum]CEF75337.1 unnamed protein product [Fusarium graminearum]CZS78616.1 unnamed protein product [Fusarium graminearum]
MATVMSAARLGQCKKRIAKAGQQAAQGEKKDREEEGENTSMRRKSWTKEIREDNPASRHQMSRDPSS